MCRFKRGSNVVRMSRGRTREERGSPVPRPPQEEIDKRKMNSGVRYKLKRKAELEKANRVRRGQPIESSV